MIATKTDYEFKSTFLITEPQKYTNKVIDANKSILLLDLFLREIVMVNGDYDTGLKLMRKKLQDCIYITIATELFN